MRPLCIYHGNCADGFGAAWVVNRALMGEVDFHAGIYQDPPPDVKDRFVIMVDFSYKRPVLQEMAAEALGILVLDHHKTAMADLEPDPMDDTFAVALDMNWKDFSASFDVWGPDDRGIYTLFDMKRSGAGITWDFFFPNNKRPDLINHIEDRDLWKFALPHTREIQAALFSYPYDLQVWDEMMFGQTDRLYAEGVVVERKHHKDIKELVPVVTRLMRIKVPHDLDASGRVVSTTDFIVPMANLPYTMTADAGHLLCGAAFSDGGVLTWMDPPNEDIGVSPFAGCYWDTPKGRQFSLRSRKHGIDVGEIAKLYGGGGHANASGFRVPFDQLAQFEP